jgi:hypothetical protein
MTEAGKREEIRIGRALRLDRRGALELLRDLARDRAVLADLRRLWARETAATTLCFAPDDQVLAQLADRVASGALVVARVRPPLPKAPPPGAGAVAGEASAPVEVAKKAEPAKDKGALSNPRWSVDRVEVGAEVDAAFTYAGFEPGEAVTIKVYEVNANGSRREVDKVEVAVPAKGGDHKAKWKRDPDKAAADLKEDESEGDNGPLEYRFTAEAEGVGATGLSDKLWLTNTVNVNLNDDKGKPLESARIVVLKDFEREQRVKSDGGKAKFEKVLVGPIEVRLAEPKFTDLGWSAPKVPVGEAVDAVFKYEDAIKGMKVTVVIHEFNVDGTSTELKREEVELKAEGGEAKVSFTRTEDEAQEDIAADEREGDTGPLEYRFRVMTDTGGASDVSEPLWLTNTVVVRLTSTGDHSLDALRSVVLRDASGEEKRVVPQGGQAIFEEVLVGAIDIWTEIDEDG